MIHALLVLVLSHPYSMMPVYTPLPSGLYTTSHAIEVCILSFGLGSGSHSSCDSFGSDSIATSFPLHFIPLLAASVALPLLVSMGRAGPIVAI